MRDTKIQALIIEKKQLQDPIDAFTADSVSHLLPSILILHCMISYDIIYYILCFFKYLSICSLISNYIARDQHQFNLEGEKLASTCRTYGYYKAKVSKIKKYKLKNITSCNI